MKMNKDLTLFNILGYTLVSLAAIASILPLILLISGSFTAEADISRFGYSLLPSHVSTAAYDLIFKYPADILRAYGVSILITVVGSGLGLIVTTMAAYVLNRPEFRYRNGFTFYFYFVTLFNGGLVSTYIFVIRYLHLKNSFLALILPLLVNVFYLLIMRSFMKSIPESIIESAKIEGAGEFFIFHKLVLPLAKPALATIGLFLALDYWNDWSNAMLYITDYRKFPLQYMLYSMLSSTEAMSRISTASSVPLSQMPSQSLKLAMAVVATGPIILAYPAVQKYFVKGITVGAVKG